MDQRVFFFTLFTLSDTSILLCGKLLLGRSLLSWSLISHWWVLLYTGNFVGLLLVSLVFLSLRRGESYWMNAASWGSGSSWRFTFLSGFFSFGIPCYFAGSSYLLQLFCRRLILATGKRCFNRSAAALWERGTSILDGGLDLFLCLGYALGSRRFVTSWSRTASLLTELTSHSACLFGLGGCQLSFALSCRCTYPFKALIMSLSCLLSSRFLRNTTGRGRATRGRLEGRSAFGFGGSWTDTFLQFSLLMGKIDFLSS